MPSSNLRSVSWGRGPPVWRFFYLEVITMSKTTKKKQKAIHVSNKMLAQIPNEGDPKPVTPKNCKNPCPYGAGIIIDDGTNIITSRSKANTVDLTLFPIDCKIIAADFM